MTMLKRCFVLIGLISLLAVPAYGADAGGTGPLPDAAPDEEAALTSAGIQLDPLFLAKGGGKGRLSGFLIPQGVQDAAAACEWFYIDCIEEEDKLCCGSLSSCLLYCEEICNGPCGAAI